MEDMKHIIKMSGPVLLRTAFKADAKESHGVVGTSDYQSPKFLTYFSAPQAYGFLPDAKPFTHENATIKISELWDAPDKNGIGQYRIKIEVPVNNLSDLNETIGQSNELINDLEKIWHYVCGETMNPSIIFTSFDDTPSGWESNAKELQEFYIMNSGKPYGRVSTKPGHWSVLPYYPLFEALNAVTNLRADADIVKSLVEVHFQAASSNRSSGRLFLFANALELVEKLLPGKNREDKQKKLSPEFQENLTKPLHWLFNIANNRFNIRHAIKNPEGPELHPRATGEEITEFENNCNLLIRLFIGKRWSIQIPIAKRSSTPPKLTK